MNSFDDDEPSPSLVTLPTEVMQYLISFFDAKSLLALTFVSKRWNYLIFGKDYSVQKHWRKVCADDIPKDYILDILQSMYPKYWFGDNGIFWNDIYTCWHMWKMPSGLDFKVTKLCTVNSEITSIIFSGEWIFIGTREGGGLQAFNYNTSQRMVCVRRCGPVKNVYLRCTSDNKIEDDYLLKNVEHDEVIIQLPWNVITYDLLTGKTSEFGQMKNMLQKKHFENQEVQIHNRVKSSELICSNLKTDECYKLNVEGTVCNVLQIWKGGILVLFDSGELQVYDFELNPRKHPLNVVKLDASDLLQNRIHYVWHMDVLFILGPLNYGNSWIEIFVGNKVRKYFPFTTLNTMITAAHYHAGILLLGSDLGELYIYRVENDEELLSLNLSEPMYKVEITDDAIQSLAITYTTSGIPFIAAGSLKDLYLISIERKGS